MVTSLEAIKVNELTKIYGHSLTFKNHTLYSNKTVGVRNISFTINEGEIFGFLGPNGAGKTTTIRAMLDYLSIQNGDIAIFGLDHKKKRMEIRNIMAYIPGDMTLFDNFTGLELLNYLGHFKTIDQQFLQELKSIFKVNLEKKIKFLSKGNKQQVGLIAALATKPKLLVLDEPSSGLDPLMTDYLHKILLKMRKSGTTIFISSHDLAEVHAICDRVGIIKEGKMILIESITELEKKFLQKVEIEYNSDSIPPESFFKNLKTVISVTKVTNSIIKLNITGDVNELFKALINYNIKRFTCENASLEDIFLQYYQ